MANFDQSIIANHRQLHWALFGLMMVISLPALAFQQTELDPKSYQEMFEAWQPAEAKGKALTWEIFAETEEIEECIIDADGFDLCLIKPNYGSKISKLNNQEVTLIGYMFPLSGDHQQSQFLLGPYPLTCPFHYHLGPALVVEVIAKEAITFSYQPIIVKGRLSLDYNWETGVFYYLNDGQLSN